MSGEIRTAILRAEILRDDSAEITCALEMTDESVFIVTDGLPSIGDIVSLRLSFPRAVRPIVVSTRVFQVRMSSGPGSPSGFVGSFEIESDDGKRRVADVARRLSRTTSPPSVPRNGAPRLSVLLVEDNKLIRDMFTYAVERYFGSRSGHVHVTQAATVAEAWDMLRAKGDFDLAIVDHRLPDGTGAGFIQDLRANPSLGRQSIVGMSVGGPEVRRAMLDAGADIFLHKPIVLKDLFCTLEFMMDAGSESDRGAA